MRWKPTLLALALLAATATSLAQPIPDDPLDLLDPPEREEAPRAESRSSEEPSLPPEGPSREELETSRVTYDAAAGGWSAYRLPLSGLWNTDGWDEQGGSANLTLFLAFDPDEGATPALQLSLYSSGQDDVVTVPFTMPAGEPTVETLEIQVGCSSDCGEQPGGQLAFVAASMDAPTRVHLGIPQDLPEDPEEALAAIEDRPRLDEHPDASGEGAAAGMYAYGVDELADAGAVEVGRIDASMDRTLQLGPAQVDRHVEVTVDEPIAGDGSAQVLVGLVEHAGAHAWSIGAHVPDRTVNGSGMTVATPPTLDGPVTTQRQEGLMPGAYVDLEPEEGPVRLDVDQRFTGAEGPGTVHLASWAWTGADVTELYGWPREDSATVGGIDLSLDGELCRGGPLSVCVSLPVPP